MFEAQRIKDIVIQMLIILREMGYFTQQQLKDISKMIDDNFNKPKVNDNENFFN